MRSAFKGFAALLLLCACGNLSNEDIAFVEALPRNADLHVLVPVQSAQQACALGQASQWAVGARDTGDKLNAAVDAVLGIINAIRSSSPTSRKPDLRVWSFPDQKHPGVQMEASLLRVATQPGSDPAAQPWSFAIDARRDSGPFLEVLYAYFVGSEARTGQGVIAINFDNSRALQINGPTDPTGVMMRTRPVAVQLFLLGEPGRQRSLRLSFPGREREPLLAADRVHRHGCGESAHGGHHSVHDGDAGRVLGRDGVPHVRARSAEHHPDLPPIPSRVLPGAGQPVFLPDRALTASRQPPPYSAAPRFSETRPTRLRGVGPAWALAGRRAASAAGPGRAACPARPARRQAGGHARRSRWPTR